MLRAGGEGGAQGFELLRGMMPVAASIRPGHAAAEPFFRGLGYTVTDRGSASDDVKQSAQFRSLCLVSAVCI